MADLALVADENVHAQIIEHLRSRGVAVFSVREQIPGISDDEVARIALDREAVLVTEDSDFGELVFSRGVHSLGVVFLRYSFSDVETVARQLSDAVLNRELRGRFSTVTKNRIRQRLLP